MELLLLSIVTIVTIAIAPILGIKLAHKLWAEKKIIEEWNKPNPCTKCTIHNNYNTCKTCKIREEYLNNPTEKIEVTYDLWWGERIKEKKLSAGNKRKKKDAYTK